MAATSAALSRVIVKPGRTMPACWGEQPHRGGVSDHLSASAGRNLQRRHRHFIFTLNVQRPTGRRQDGQPWRGRQQRGHDLARSRRGR